MFDSTVIELIITHASAPSTPLVFCLCNIIIFFLLVDRSTKSNLNPCLAYDYRFSTAIVNSDVTEDMLASEVVTEKATAKVCEDDNEENEDSKTTEDEEDVVTEKATANEGENECENDNKENADSKTQEDEENLEEGDSDELRRRVEEFIDKINREWRAEKLRTSGQRVI